MDTPEKDINGLERLVREKIKDLPKLEEKLASQDKKIAYLIKRLARMEGVDVEVEESPGPAKTLESRLANLRRVLADHGLEVSGFNECGIVKLKPSNETGFDTLRKLNTMFSIEILECYFEEHHG
jgi:hypothetical protein